MVKMFVLTRVANEQNYTPRVFQNQKDAINAMINDFDNIRDNVVEKKFTSKTKAEVDYVDDTYDVFQIFEVELQ
jgi:hypothetical protein